MESNLRSPCEFTLKSREKFGDPNARAMSKTVAMEPGLINSQLSANTKLTVRTAGPGQYDLSGKFVSGPNPRKAGFPKGLIPRDKGSLGPGPGSYEPLQSMGKQSLSTKPGAVQPFFPIAERPSMVAPGTTEIGPGEYGAFNSACEAQVDSRKPTCGSIKFGTGYKKGSWAEKKDLSEPSPGPGAYPLPPTASTRAASLSGRGKFGSPW
jgi:hypothetical protein